MKTTFISLILFIFSFVTYGQTEDSIAYTFLVADYYYTCHTSNAQEEDMDVNYGLTLQVAGDMACTMGQKRHSGENDNTEQLLYVPITWLNYPKGYITSVETVPPYQYLTSEKIEKINWTLQEEYDTICGYPCQKATGRYGGRLWAVWFAESLPTKWGPWRLRGLPGLIMRAISDDGIHSFECRNVETVKEAIIYTVPEEVIKCSRSKFVKLRNRIFSNPNYISNPTYYIKPEELSNVFVIKNMLILGNLPIDMKPAKFQPLDY